MKSILSKTFRLQFASKLYVDNLPISSSKTLLKPVAPVLALLGDIGLPNSNTRDFIRWCDDNYSLVLWVPGSLELCDSERKKHTWSERVKIYNDFLAGSDVANTEFCSKKSVHIDAPELQLLLTPLMESSTQPMYTESITGPKRMEEEDYDKQLKQDMNWLLQHTITAKSPISWLTYTSPFRNTGQIKCTDSIILKHTDLVCSLQGTSDCFKAPSYYNNVLPWSSVNMGGYGFMNDLVWKYTKKTNEAEKMEEHVIKSLLSL